MSIAKDLKVDGAVLIAAAEWSAEIDAKRARLVEWMSERELHGVLLRRNENIAWLTGGAVELRVLTPAETGVGSVLVTVDGRCFYLTTENEAPRLAEEEFGALGFEPVIFPWFADATVERALEVAGPHVACDQPTPGMAPAHLYPLRASLSAAEIRRFRWLGAATAAATVEVLRELKPGVSEFEMEARVAAALLRRGILPSVLLMAVDERIVRYKHAVARGRRLERFAMLNLCARRWGLTVSITRFAHMGAMPDELKKGFEAASKANAALLHHTRAGATAAELYRAASQAYVAAGFAGEERRHHQGGATGYWEREWVATPEGTERVVDGQAFAWNPSAAGGKAEDTVLLRDGTIETLTATPELPELKAMWDGVEYASAGVLLL